jgi:ABC-type multidrug transport system fused ATPase/permease subunit
MENPHGTKRVVLIYALLSLIIRLIYAQLDLLLTWYGRRCYERSRGEMIMMIFEKATTRKNVIGSAPGKESNGPVSQTNGSVPNGVSSVGKSAGFTSRLRQHLSLLGRFLGRGHRQPSEQEKKSASMGKVLNLFRGDVYEIAQRFWEIDRLIKGPIGLIVAVALVWSFLGPSCFIAILVLIIGQAINAVITRELIRWGRYRKEATDHRLQITSQFIEVIRHLRWYGWQSHWLKQVDEARAQELNVRIKFMLIHAALMVVNTMSSGLFPVVGLYAYTVLAHHKLSIDIIFPALTLFVMLNQRLMEIPNLITTMINASVSLGRIEEFMQEAEVQGNQWVLRDEFALELTNCAFAWPEMKEPVIRDINIKFSEGLTVLHGRVGSGKSALLQALLGELDLLNGECHVPDQTIGYCAQSPWLQSMSIRDNILFFSPFDEARYRKVLDACELLPDFDTFKDGDLSNIGENGIGLSGGQRARVALARAVYSRADILLLDDPLSALDHETAESIVRKLLAGPLAQGRIIVLATHRIDLVRQLAKQFVEIEDGRAKVGSIEVLSESSESVFDGTLADETPESNEQKDSGAAAKFMDDEHRAERDVQIRVYLTYIKAGGIKFWILAISVLSISELSKLLYSWFLKAWGEAYTTSGSGITVQIQSLIGGVFFSIPSRIFSQTATSLPFNPLDPFAKLPPPEENVAPWLWIYLAISISQPFITLAFMLVDIVIIYRAAKQLFTRVMVKVANASFRFYDVTPVGRLMNRLTSDISSIDGNISQYFITMSTELLTFVASVVVIALITPAFLIAAIILMITLVYIFMLFLPTSQSLRRLETVSLSPLFANFGELLQGLTTVRAFHSQQKFQERIIAVVDNFQGMDHFYWSVQSWLMFRFNSISAISTFTLTAMAVYSGLTPGMTAFMLMAANRLVNATMSLCRGYGQLQMEFVSVERVEELLHIDQEPTGVLHPPAAWPRFGGDILFEDVTVRYAPHLDPALQNLSIRIPGGSTTALVGRTGSGKSTLAQALLAVVRAESGTIFMDGLDISKVDTETLRHRVTFVAQDPVLFNGTIRHNLDPTETYTDFECSAVLARVCARQGWNLDTFVENGGKNLSQGQRQLIGITRAVLRRSPVVIMDEATASIDYETAAEIQGVLREELGEATVITIAHRVEAVRGADWCVVLGGGKVLKQGKPEDVL